MNEASSTSSLPADPFAATPDVPPAGLVSSYRLDHQNPVNHFLHVGVGWPMVAISILILPFRPVWSAFLFVGGVRDHVLRSFRLRAQHADHFQRAHHAFRHGRFGDPRPVERTAAANSGETRGLADPV